MTEEVTIDGIPIQDYGRCSQTVYSSSNTNKGKILIDEQEYFELLRYKKLYLQFIKCDKEDREDVER